MILAQEFTSRCHIFKTTMKDMNKARGNDNNNDYNTDNNHGNTNDIIMIQYLNKVRLLIIFSMH